MSDRQRYGVRAGHPAIRPPRLTPGLTSCHFSSRPAKYSSSGCAAASSARPCPAEASISGEDVLAIVHLLAQQSQIFHQLWFIGMFLLQFGVTTAMVASGVPSSWAAPAASVPSATIRSLRRVSSRARPVPVARPDRVGHAHHEKSDEKGREHKSQPHAGKVQIDGGAEIAVSWASADSN